MGQGVVEGEVRGVLVGNDVLVRCAQSKINQGAP